MGYSCCCSVTKSCPTLCDPMDWACQAPLSFTVSWSLLTFVSIESLMLYNHLLCHPLLLLTSVFPSIRIFSNDLALHIRWPKYLSFSFSISPSNEYLGLISFRIDWFDLPAVQGTLKSLLRNNSKASILWLSLLYGPALTFMHDYWKDHSFDYMDGYQYVLVIACMFSGWIEAFLCRKADGTTIAEKLLENIFPSWGFPWEISNERGTHFIRQIIKQIKHCWLRGIIIVLSDLVMLNK